VEQAKAALVFAQQQQARYEDLAQKGYGPVQSAQQYIADQREKQAAVDSAEANLKLAQRQIDSLNAQRARRRAWRKPRPSATRRASISTARKSAPRSTAG
jgi:membrane fusion protein (multidrug efflux system)